SSVHNFRFGGARQAYDELLQGYGCELEAGTGRLGALRLGEAADGGRGESADAVAVQDLAAGDERVDARSGADDGDRRAAELLRLGVDDESTAIDDQDVLKEVTDLVDEVRREDDGPRSLGHVGQQAIVEQLP